MASIKDKVAVIGTGCTNFGELWEKGPEDMLVEAVYEAYEDAGVDADDIQAAWVGTTGTGLTGQLLAYPLKLNYVPITRVENACATGTDAFRNACYAIAAGLYDIVLVAGIDKFKDTGFGGLPIQKPFYDPSNVQPEVMFPTQFALLATRYFYQYGLSYEEGKRILAQIAVKNHHNGTLSPKAHFRREITIEQAINAPMISWPLGLFDCCGVSDGAAAAIITRADLASKFRDDYVLVKGLGLACGKREGELDADYDFVHAEETVVAGGLAYGEVGIKNPRKEIDLACVHDCFSITELVIYEDLGFSHRGRAGEDVESGTFAIDGELPVNTDGGLKCFGHPVGATGLRMIYEIYKQLQGKAGPRQVKNARMGLTQNLGGVPGSFTCGVAILGQRD